MTLFMCCPLSSVKIQLKDFELHDYPATNDTSFFMDFSEDGRPL